MARTSSAAAAPTQFRSLKTGRFVSARYAKTHPKTTCAVERK